MADETALERFNALSGSQSKKIDIALLSSAQRARFVSWVVQNGIKIDGLEIGEGDSGFEKNEQFVHDKATQPTEPKNVSAIGIDIQGRSALFPNPIIDLKGDLELSNMFTQKEIAYAESRPDPELTLTGIFAAKEALLKAGWSNKGVKDLNKIVISHDIDGRPTHPNFLVSISHDEGLAVAVAIKIIKVSNNEAVRDSVPDLLRDVVQGSEHSKQISWWQCFLLILISVAASTILQNTSFSSLAFNLFD